MTHECRIIEDVICRVGFRGLNHLQAATNDRDNVLVDESQRNGGESGGHSAPIADRESARIYTSSCLLEKHLCRQQH